jgi:uncharacterized protein YjbI with pentapeptide repeats
MLSKLKMTENVRNKIKGYIKNGMDISELIADYDISNEDFSGAVIKNLTRINEKIINTKFIRCIFGDKDNIINFSGSDLKGCNFSYARFNGLVWFRRADLRNVNFNDAFVPQVEYQYSDLRNASICNTVFRLSSKAGLGAKLEWKQFELLAKYMQLDIQK